MSNGSTGRTHGNWPKLPVVMAIVITQVIAAIYFLVDAAIDLTERLATGSAIELAMDCIVAVALIAGIVTGARWARHMAAELRMNRQSLEVARGALFQQLTLRFAEWGLTKAESEIALFAIKGCSVSEIAELRGAATGTVRSQLSQVYAKAGVSSQSMLVSLLIDDLLQTPLIIRPDQ